MFRIAVVAAMLVFGGCEDEGEEGDASVEAKLHLSEIGEQKAGMKFALNIEIQVDGKAVTTGDIADTGVTVQWKCADEEYTDENKVEDEIKNGKVEVKIAIGNVDDLEDKTDCKIKATVQIADKKIEIESQVFIVKAQTIKISLTKGTVLGAKISDVITGIKNDAGDVPLDKATISINEECRDVKLVRWPSSETDSPAELKNSSADAQDVYLANHTEKVDANCILIVSLDEGQKHGVVPLSDKEADYSIATVFEPKPNSGKMQINLQEVSTETNNYQLYLVYDSDNTKNDWYKLGDGSYGIANGAITLTSEGSDYIIPDGFYYKIEDKVLFWVSEPTVIDEIVALENQGRKFNVRYVPGGTTLTLADKTTADADSCGAELYQVGTEVSHPTVSGGTETFSGVDSLDRFDTVANLFVIGDPANCVLKAGDKNVVASFASKPEPSKVAVTVGANDDGKIEVTVVGKKVAPKNSGAFVLDSDSYKLIDDSNSDDTTHTSAIASDGDDTALVRTDIEGNGTWLLWAKNKTAM